MSYCCASFYNIVSPDLHIPNVGDGRTFDKYVTIFAILAQIRQR